MTKPEPLNPPLFEPAFVGDGKNLLTLHSHLTLRDLFAAAALAGNLAAQTDNGEPGFYPDTPAGWGTAAEQAYKAADAMLKERAK